MKIEDCKHVVEWNYSFYKDNDNYPRNMNQTDWNQTLLAMINQISARIFKSSYRGGANKIKINSNLLPLLETLEYYQPILMSISSRYSVIIDNELDSSVVFLEHDFKEIEFSDALVNNINYPIDNNGVVKPLLTIEDYKKSLLGCIKILNYIKE